MSLEKVGDYTITREIGQGGMGKVFQALSPQGVTVALKTVMWPETLDARTRWETVERFQREARAARSLSHPNICQVIDIGAEQDTFFIVMEFLDGQSVRDLIKIAGGIKPERAAEIMGSVCEALAYAHDQGIIHRDIKPDNIMVLRSGEVKLMDFGLASIAYEKGVTQTGTTMGTFCYMSPEQAQGSKADARSDIFSLGATFHEMLSGRRAFEGDSPAAVVSSILNAEVAPPSGCPSQLSRAVAKCLRKRPEHRFQSVRELMGALSRGEAATDTAVTAVLPGPQKDAGASYSSPTPGAVSARRGAPPRAETEPAGRRSDLRCPKCNEPMSGTTPSCWRCGTPNPVIAQRAAHKKYQTEIGAALQDLRSNRRKGGRPKGNR